MTTDELIKKIKTKRLDEGNVYDYSKTVYVNANTKISIICPIHGIFKQRAHDHINGSGCVHCTKSQKLTKIKFLNKLNTKRLDKGDYYDYSLVPDIIGNGKEKISIICPMHGLFTQYVMDHIAGHSCKKCALIKVKHNLLEKYGITSVSQLPEIKEKIKQTNIRRYGEEFYTKTIECKQKTKETNIIKYGVENPTSLEEVQERVRKTNLSRYGVDNHSKLMESRERSRQIMRNNNSKMSYSSKEARKFIKEYIKNKGYSLNQVAYSDPEYALYEYPFRIDNRLIFYDLVVFEEGYRGDTSKIIEILEYHGPFHYTPDEVKEFGYKLSKPWDMSSKTVMELYEIDCFKKEYANTLTQNYTIKWADNRHTSGRDKWYTDNRIT